MVVDLWVVLQRTLTSSSQTKLVRRLLLYLFFLIFSLYVILVVLVVVVVVVVVMLGAKQNMKKIEKARENSVKILGEGFLLDSIKEGKQQDKSLYYLPLSQIEQGKGTGSCGVVCVCVISLSDSHFSFSLSDAPKPSPPQSPSAITSSDSNEKIRKQIESGKLKIKVKGVYEQLDCSIL